jgi:hypothetical protein
MTRHIVITDPQIKQGRDTSFLRAIGNYCSDKRPDTIVCIGDFADMPSLSLYDVGKKSFEGRTYKDDVASVHEGMEVLMSPIQKEIDRIRRNKKKQWNPRLVMTLGNHEDRIDRAINLDRKLDGLISIDDLKYTSWGWEVIPFLEPINIDGVLYCHYFCSGVMGRPVTTARQQLLKMHMSCVAGHQQGRDVAYSKRGDGRQMTSIIAGSSYPDDEGYLNSQTNKHWRGIIMLNEVEDGSFDEMFVSTDYLLRKYDS